MERILSNKEINDIKIHLPENVKTGNQTIREALVNIVKSLLGKK